MYTKLETSRSADRSERLRWLLTRGLLAALLTLLITPPALAMLYASALVDAPCQGLFTPPDPSSVMLSFDDPQGRARRGWLTIGAEHPDVVIIVLPGLAGNSSAAASDAQTLAAAGYSTFVYEHRTCAHRAAIASTGYAESRDLLAAVSDLAARGDFLRIAVLGFSEGGTASLLAAAEEPRIDALIAMGGYASLRGQVEEAANSAWGRLMTPLYLAALQLRGVDVAASDPAAVISRIAPRPLLLIYGSLERDNGEALYAAAGPGADLWIVEGAGHGAYRTVAGAEYEMRITEFFRDALR